MATNPGYVERGPQWYEQNEKDTKGRNARNGATKLRGHDLRRPRRRNMERSMPGGGSHLEGFDYMSHSATSRPAAVDEASRDLQAHYTKEVFVCEGDGRPIWCAICMNWKPDRAHHCREIDRCVRKMDHYCPWWVSSSPPAGFDFGRCLYFGKSPSASVITSPAVSFVFGKAYLILFTSSRVAGVIGETTFKFFIQYSLWAAVYCIFVLVITAIVIAEERRKVSLLIRLCAPEQGTLGDVIHHTILRKTCNRW